MKIKDFATLCQCSIYTLRYYDKIGLLKPEAVNDQSGYRYYNEQQITRFQEIKELQEIGFSVSEIKAMKNLKSYEVINLILLKMTDLQKQLDKSVVLINKYKERRE